MSYCQHCGKKLTENERCSCQEAKKSVLTATAKKNNSAKKLLIPIVALIVLIVAGIFIFRPGKPEINLEDYIVIEGVEGLNTQGVLKYSVDSVALRNVMITDNLDEMTDESFSEITSEHLAQYEAFSDAYFCIALTASAETGLSNGDEVTVTATFENPDETEFEYKFNDGSVTYTVEGLVEGKTVDPFSDDAVAVSFTGFSGQGEADFTITAEEEIYQYLTYSLSSRNSLSNGDTVILSVQFDSAELESIGYFSPEQTEKSFTVAGLPRYFQLSDELPDALLDTLCTDALQRTQKKHDEWIINMGYANAVEPEIIGAYFLEAADPTFPYKDFYNNIDIVNAIMVMTHHTTQGTGFSSDMKYDMWRTYIYPNFIVDSDGIIAYDTSVVGGFNYSYTGSAEATLEAQKFEYRDVIFTQIEME